MKPSVKPKKYVLPAVLCLMLAGCSSDAIQMTESTWLVTNIYVDPDEPNVISDLVITQPTLDFGHSSLSGHTGCAPFQGRAAFSHEGEPSTSDEADYLTFADVEFDELPEDCQGQERLVHDRLVDLLPGSFDITRNSDTEILLTSDVNEIDRPSIRLMSWIAPS